MKTTITEFKTITQERVEALAEMEASFGTSKEGREQWKEFLRESVNSLKRLPTQESIETSKSLRIADLDRKVNMLEKQVERLQARNAELSRIIEESKKKKKRFFIF